MGCTTADLTIEDALVDPVIGAAMRADRVDPRQFERLLRSTARELDDARRPPPPLAALIARVRCASSGTMCAW